MVAGVVMAVTTFATMVTAVPSGWNSSTLLVTVAPSGRMRTGPSKFGRVMTSLSAGGNGYVESEHRLVALSTAAAATYSTVRYMPVPGQFRRTRSNRLVDTDFRRAD